MSADGQAFVFIAQIHKIWIMRCVEVPKNISKAIRQAAGGKALRVPVHGWVEGLPTRGTLVPAGDGCYRMHLHSRIWRKLKIDAGAAVEVALQLDLEPRETPVPADLAATLADEPRALAAFHVITTALRRQLIEYVQSAKHFNTREKRIRMMIRRMLERDAKRRKAESKAKSKEKRNTTLKTKTSERVNTKRTTPAKTRTSANKKLKHN
ncbi:MAG TPA: YdeI/OmpD-associated family protein [Candidatus Acidoferrum sp.]|jgi:hypothetical protein